MPIFHRTALASRIADQLLSPSLPAAAKAFALAGHQPEILQKALSGLAFQRVQNRTMVDAALIAAVRKLRHAAKVEFLNKLTVLPPLQAAVLGGDGKDRPALRAVSPEHQGTVCSGGPKADARASQHRRFCRRIRAGSAAHQGAGVEKRRRRLRHRGQPAPHHPRPARLTRIIAAPVPRPVAHSSWACKR